MAIPEHPSENQRARCAVRAFLARQKAEIGLMHDLRHTSYYRQWENVCLILISHRSSSAKMTTVTSCRSCWGLLGRHLFPFPQAKLQILECCYSSLPHIRLPGCYPMNTYLGVDPIEHSGIYFSVNIDTGLCCKASIRIPSYFMSLCPCKTPDLIMAFLCEIHLNNNILFLIY